MKFLDFIRWSYTLCLHVHANTLPTLCKVLNMSRIGDMYIYKNKFRYVRHADYGRLINCSVKLKFFFIESIND